MNARARNLLRGAGTIMDLAPNRDLRQMVSRRTGAERMAAHFAHVGESVTRACGAFGGDGNTDTTEAKTV